MTFLNPVAFFAKAVTAVALTFTTHLTVPKLRHSFNACARIVCVVNSSKPPPTPSKLTPQPLTTKQYLESLPNPWPCIADHESTDNPTAINPISGDSGAFSIAQSTWLEFGGLRYSWSPRWASVQDQYRIALRILAGQGWQAWVTAPLCGV